MEIAEHLEEHEATLRALAYQYAGDNQDLWDDCYQAGALALIEAHVRFRHESELLTYAYRDIRKAMLKQVKLAHGESTYGVIAELEELQEKAEDQGNDKKSVEPLYGVRHTEQGISFEEVALAQSLREKLDPEDWLILEASFGRGQRLAAETLGMPLMTYNDRLRSVKKKIVFHQELLSRAS